MALPTIEEFLAALNRNRRDGIRLRDEALANGDKRLARSFQAQIAQIEKMILKKGGTMEA